MKYFRVKFSDSHYASLTYTKLKNKAKWISQHGDNIAIEPGSNPSPAKLMTTLKLRDGFESLKIVEL